MSAPTININPTAISKTALKSVIKAAWQAVLTHLTALYDLIEALTTYIDVVRKYQASFLSELVAVVAPVATGIVADGSEGDNPTTIKIKITTVTADGETTASNEVTAELTDDTTEAILSWAAASGATKYRVYYKYDSDATYAGYIETADATVLSMDVSGTLVPDEAEQPPSVSDAGTVNKITTTIFNNTTDAVPTVSDAGAGIIEIGHATIFDGDVFIHNPLFQYIDAEEKVIKVTAEKASNKIIVKTYVDGVLSNATLSPSIYTLSIDLKLPS